MPSTSWPTRSVVVAAAANETATIGASTVSAKCGNGSWTFSGTLGAASSMGANSAGFGFTLLGHVHDNATNTDVACTTFDLTAYSGFSTTLASASGAITRVSIGVDLADKSQGHVEIPVTTTATTVVVSWAQLGITGAAAATGISGTFINGANSVTDDLVITSFALE